LEEVRVGEPEVERRRNHPAATAPRQIATLPPGIVGLDPTPERQRFLAILPERTGPGSVSVGQNWRRSIPDR
jgi:hypothetical protein